MAIPVKYLKIADLRHVLDLLYAEEISFSRMVEILNERIAEKLNNNLTNQTMTDLSFGQAIEALNEGKQVQRSGWNGKGMFIFKTFGREIAKEEFLKFKNGNSDAISLAEKLGTHKSETVKICDHLDMLAADGSIVVGWLASQTDMQAKDWQVVS
jgi:hypothetical protein